MGINSANSANDAGYRDPTLTRTATAPRVTTSMPRTATAAPTATTPSRTITASGGGLSAMYANALSAALSRDATTGSESWAGWGAKPTATPATPAIPATPGVSPATPAIPASPARPSAAGTFTGPTGMMGRGENLSGETIRGMTAASANGNTGPTRKPSPMAGRMSPTRLQVAKALTR